MTTTMTKSREWKNGVLGNIEAWAEDFCWLLSRSALQARGAGRCIVDLGRATDGGPLDYAGRILMVDGQEFLVRVFDWVDPTGHATVVVRPDGYQRIVRRTGNDNDLLSMKLCSELDETLRKALRDYIAASYMAQVDGEVTLKLG